MENLANPVLYLKKGFFFPRNEIGVDANFRGRKFQLISDYEEQDIFVPHGEGGGGSGTRCNFIWMEFKADSEKVSEIFESVNDISNILSTFAEDAYFETTSLDTYFYPGSLRWNRGLNFPETFSGIQVEGRSLANNLEITNYFGEVNKLKEEDFNYFRSAVNLLKEAKRKFFRGEDSAAVVNAISGVEALYLRPDSEGIFRKFDERLIDKKGLMAEVFKKVFFEAGGADAEAIYLEKGDLYGMRAGHLHSGKIDIYSGHMPRNTNDSILKTILICQKIIISSTTCFLK